MVAPVNDNRADATEVFGASGSIAGTLTDATLNSSHDFYGFGVWYKTTPATSGLFVVSVDNPNVHISSWLQVGASYPLVTYLSTDDGTTESLTFTVDAGSTYYIAVEAGDSAAAANAIGSFLFSWAAASPEGLDIDGSVSVPLEVSDADLFVASSTSMSGTVETDWEVLDAPLPNVEDFLLTDDTVDFDTDVSATMDAPTTIYLLGAYVIWDVDLSLSGIDTTALHLSSPDDGEVVITHRPEFMVGLVPNNDADEADYYTIEVQYDSTVDFTDTPVTLSVTIQVADGGAVLIPTSDVPDSTWWRARLLDAATEVVGWRPAQQFTVNSVVTAVDMDVTWTVNSSADRPIHLWHFDPPGVLTGDTVTAYGQGFPLSTGNITIADLPVTVDSWTLVAASDAAATDERVIDVETVDPEHFEVVFTVPDIEEPGGPVVVEA